MLNSPRHALWMLHLSILLLGFSGLFGKWLPIDTGWIVLGRGVVGSAVLVGFLACVGKARLLLARGVWLNLGLGVLLALHWMTFFKAIQVSTVAIGLLAFSSFPIFVTLLEPLLFKEPLRKVDVFSTVGVVVGMCIIFPPATLMNDPALLNGLMWGVLSGFIYAFLSLANRQRVAQTDSIVLTAQQNFGAALTALLFVPLSQGSVMLDYAAELVALGLLCTTIPQLFFINSFRHLKAQLISVMTCLEPVYSIIFAAVLLAEIPSLQILLGGVVILCAILLGTLFRIQSDEQTAVLQ